MSSVKISKLNNSFLEENSPSEIHDFNLSSDDDDDEEYISPEELIEKLEKIIENVKEKVYTDIDRQDIADSMEEYISGNNLKTLDPEAVSYLFRGWWVTDALKRISNPNLTNGEKLPPLETCPFCLKKMKSSDEINMPKEESSNK